jgi:hypothetical protein
MGGSTEGSQRKEEKEKKRDEAPWLGILTATLKASMRAASLASRASSFRPAFTMLFSFCESNINTQTSSWLLGHPHECEAICFRCSLICSRLLSSKEASVLIVRTSTRPSDESFQMFANVLWIFGIRV